jgi:hypothetical protein
VKLKSIYICLKAQFNVPSAPILRADELPYPNVTVCYAKYFDKRWLAGSIFVHMASSQAKNSWIES